MESINNATPNTTNSKANNERKLVRFTNSTTSSFKFESCRSNLNLNHEQTVPKSSSLLKNEDSLDKAINIDLNETNIRQDQIKPSSIIRRSLATSLSSPKQVDAYRLTENKSEKNATINAKPLNRHSSVDCPKINKSGASYSGSTLSALLHYTSLASYGDRQKRPLLTVEVDNYLTLPVSFNSITKCLQKGPHHINTSSILSTNKMTSMNSNNSTSLSFNNSTNKIPTLLNNNDDVTNDKSQSTILGNANQEQERINASIKNTSLDKIDKKLFNDSHSVSSTPNLTSSSASSSSSSPPTFSTKNNQSLPVSPLLLNKTVSHTQSENSNEATTPVNATPVNIAPVPTQPLFVNRFIIKKVPDNELQGHASTSTVQNTTLVQNLTKVNETNEFLDRENTKNIPEKAISTDLDKTNVVLKSALVNDSNLKERKISKFTVLKVDASSLNNNTNANVNLNNLEISKNDTNLTSVQPSIKASSQLKEVKFAVDIDTNQSKNDKNENNLIASNLQDESLNVESNKDQSKQQQQHALQGAQNNQQPNVSQAKVEQTEEKEKEAENEAEVEDEKPIDESPDKRFLKYDIEIGRGSFKTVYKGLDTESGVPVAWCELHDRKFSKSERQRFIEEAKMLKELQHPNIVRFYEYWEDSQAKPKKIILVTELMTSGTLKAYVQRFKKQEQNKRLKVIKNFANQILKGLAYLHSRQVIHRDLKCDNVFVTGQSGQVKIGDLGLATLKKASFAKSVIGTPEFMAPEMYSELYDESIDVYAFGMCLLEMATGEYPYQECTKPFEIYKRVTQGIKPDNYNRIDNDDLKELIFLCIRLKTNQRPNVKELVNHSWFLENNGLKLEVHKDEAQNIIHKNVSQVIFRLKVADKSKRKIKWPENEEIEFLFDVDNDNTEQIVKELKESTSKITDEDFKYLIQAIKDKSKVSKLEREDALEKLENDDKTSLVNISSNAPSTVSSIAGPAQIYGTNNEQTNPNQQQTQQQKQINTSVNQITNEQPKVTTALTTNALNEMNKKVNNNNDEDLKANQSNFSVENDNSSKQPNQNNTNSEQIQGINNMNGVHQDEEIFSNDSHSNLEQSKSVIKKTAIEIPIKLTITELFETPEAGQIVNCNLEIAEKESIIIRFGLNGDSPQDITNYLLNRSINKILLNENIGTLTQFIQDIIKHINLNKQNLNFVNKQFVCSLFSTSNSKIKANENHLEIIQTPINSDVQNQQVSLNSQLVQQNQVQVQLQHQKLIQQQQQQQVLQQQLNQQQQTQNQIQQIQINQQQLNNQVQIYNNSKNLNGPTVNNAPSFLKYQQQQQQQQIHQQQFQSIHMPFMQNELFENLQQKQIQMNDDIQNLQNYLDINNLSINSIPNLNSNQSHSSVNNTYPKMNNNQIIQANSSFLNQSLQVNPHQSLTKPSHTQIQQNHSHMPISSQGGVGGGLIYNPNFSNFNQVSQMQVVAHQQFMQQTSSLNQPQIQMANTNEILTEKQNQAISQFYSKNLPQNSLKQHTVQPLQYSSQQLVNQINHSKMSVGGNVMVGQKVTSPTQLSTKLTNDNLISNQHLGNNNNNTNNFTQIQHQPIQSSQIINPNIDPSTNLSEQLHLSAYVLNNGFNSGNNNEHNFNGSNNSTTNNNNNTNLSSSSSSSFLGNNENHSGISMVTNDSNEQPSSSTQHPTVNINNQLPHLTYATVVANMANNIDQSVTNNILQNNSAQNVYNRKQPFALNDSLSEVVTDLSDFSLNSIDLSQTSVLQNPSSFLKRESDLQQQNQIKANNNANLEQLDIMLKNCLSNETPANIAVSTPPIQEPIVSIQQQTNTAGMNASANVLPNLNQNNSNIQLTQLNEPSNLRTNTINGTQIPKNLNANPSQFPQPQFISQPHILSLNESPNYSNSRRNSIDFKGTSNKLPNNVDHSNHGPKLQKANFQVTQTLPNAFHQQHQHPQHIQQQQQQLDQIDSNIQTSSNNNPNNSSNNHSNIDKSILLIQQQQQQQQHNHHQQQLYNNEIQYNSNMISGHQQQLNGAFQLNGATNPNTNSNQSFLLNHHQQQLQQQFNQQQQINNLSEKYNLIENHLNGDRLGSMLSNNVTSTVNLALFDDLFLKHRRQLEELLKRQQNELHEYVLSMQTKQVSGKKE